MPHPIQRTNLAGQTFGRLTVSDTSEIRGRRRTYWLCKCTCGNSKWVIADALKNGATRSCGCLNDETRRTVRRPGAIQNGKYSPEYIAWHSMKQRCLNPNNDRYERYGGRGITVCDRWMQFTPFLTDMGPKPSLKHTIERVDNNKGYEPGNCIWATKATQNRNHSRNRYYTFNGRRLCVTDWAAVIGIKQNTLLTRLARWPVERALTEPPRGSRSGARTRRSG